MSLGGNIGPRRPTASGENCGNCGMGFVMEPGYIQREDGVFVKWRCSGCGRIEEWPAPRDAQVIYTKKDVFSGDDVV